MVVVSGGLTVTTSALEGVTVMMLRGDRDSQQPEQRAGLEKERTLREFVLKTTVVLGNCGPVALAA